MIQRLNVHCTISALSIGQCGFNLLRELYRRKIQCAIFPREFRPEAFKIDTQFGQWLERSINDRFKKVDRKVPTLSCWHLNGSEMKPSDRQYLLSFHETDSPTEQEVNIANQQDHTFFSSSWTVDNFRTFGAQNVSFVSLGLDEDFVPVEKRLVAADITHWGCMGKWEDLRKMTGLKIRAWVRKYGGNRQHQLTLCVTNPFYVPEHMNALYARVFDGGPKPFNVNILGPMRTNAEMAQLHNSLDIDLSGISRAEGYNLPAFNSTAMGKWAIVTDCTAHRDWATAENSVQIQAGSMIPADDAPYILPPVQTQGGVREMPRFFVPGSPFNNGNMYVFTEEQIVEAFERAEKVAKTPNHEGRKLAHQFTYKRTVDEMLAVIGKGES